MCRNAGNQVRQNSRYWFILNLGSDEIQVLSFVRPISWPIISRGMGWQMKFYHFDDASERLMVHVSSQYVVHHILIILRILSKTILTLNTVIHIWCVMCWLSVSKVLMMKHPINALSIMESASLLEVNPTRWCPFMQEVGHVWANVFIYQFNSRYDTSINGWFL